MQRETKEENFLKICFSFCSLCRYSWEEKIVSPLPPLFFFCCSFFIVFLFMFFFLLLSICVFILCLVSLYKVVKNKMKFYFLYRTVGTMATTLWKENIFSTHLKREKSFFLIFYLFCWKFLFKMKNNSNNKNKFIEFIV